MENGRSLRKKTRLFSLGLPKSYVDQINGMINAVSMLDENFSEIGQNENILLSDIIFIFAENKEVMDVYRKYHSLVSATAVFVHYKKSAAELHHLIFEEYPLSETLSLPATIGTLSHLLLKIISSKKMRNQKINSSQRNVDAFKVLVVDDSFSMRKFMDEKLPKLITDIDHEINFDVQFAVSGKQAFYKVKQSRGDYDMVFLDVVMEDVNGYKVCKWMKKLKPSINVVMLTSKNSSIDRVRANLSGCDTFISKPPKDEELINVIADNDWFNRIHLSQVDTESVI